MATVICSILGCHLPRYDGSMGPANYQVILTNWCQKHFFEFLSNTQAKIKLDDNGIAFIEVPDNLMSELTDEEWLDIRVKSRSRNPAGGGLDIPWYRSQSDSSPWRDPETQYYVESD